MTKTQKQKTGDWGEQCAASFLLKKEYKIVARNFCVHKKGEIDIIAWHDKKYFGKTLCFIEVKTRKNSDDGSAERSVGKKKITSLFTAAHEYCMQYNIDIDHTAIQFEQISLYFVSGRLQINHYDIPVD
ncbi:YraN family protein [Candidatus Parcubacteria bacterium]|jgi:putative endonuclease|nr:YraN family protein [Candidatus Parcubacteria bacterium]MBT3948834.1 YraN family protein [Candidatus Parcubacteria bacterium]